MVNGTGKGVGFARILLSTRPHSAASLGSLWSCEPVRRTKCVCVRGGNGKHEENEGERVNTQKGGTGEACAPPPWSPPPDPARRGSALRERQSIAWHRIAWHLHWKPPAGLGTDERAFLDLDLQKHVVEGPLQHREENEGKKERRAQNAAHTRGKEQMAPGSDERSRIACRRKHEEEAAKK